MGTSALVVTTTTRWLGVARAPRALVNAGFDVALLAPRGSIAERTRFVSRVGHTPDGATPAQWLYAFAAMVKATTPGIVVPGDDTALRLLQALVLTPPPDLQPALHLSLAALVRDSLGEPAYYRTSIDKTALSPAAAALGVRVPPHAIVDTPDEAEAFAAVQGYPVVLKRNYSAAGDGVALCADRAALQAAFATLTRLAHADFDVAGAGRLLVQARIAGVTKYYPSVAWQGSLLAGYAGEKVEPANAPKAITTVNRYHHDAALREMTDRLARGFGITGFFSPEFMIEAGTGLPYLIEINRRLVGGAHRGAAIGVDHWAALHAAMRGLPSPTRADLDPGEAHVTVHFPAEWLRDPESRWLRDYPADVPWDDPGLFEALVALHRES